MSHVISCAVIIAALVLRGNIKAARHTLGVSSRAALDLVSRCPYILDLTLTFRNALSRMLQTYVHMVYTIRSTGSVLTRSLKEKFWFVKMRGG